MIDPNRRPSSLLVHPAAVLVGTLCAAPSSAQPCGGPIAEWTFDAGNFQDTSGFNNHGTNHGAVLAPGVFGQGITLNGNGQFVEVANSNSLNPTAAMTVAAWYSPVEWVGSGSDPIVDKGHTSHTSPFYQYHLAMAGNNYPGSGRGAFGFDVAANCVYFGPGTPNNFWNPGRWYFLVGTYDGTEARMFVDGVLFSAMPKTGAICTSNSVVRIGAFSNISPSVFSTPGSIDQIRLYNRAITAVEVRVLHLNDGRPLAEPRLSAVVEREQARFTVAAIGIGPFTHQWRRNGVPVSDGPGGASPGGGIVSGSASPVLTIDGTRRSDAGEYDCIVTTACAALTSNAAALDVMCHADCDPTPPGVLDIFDFLCFQNRYDANDPYACDCDTTSGPGVCDIFDFLCFQNAFAAGCP